MLKSWVMCQGRGVWERGWPRDRRLAWMGLRARMLLAWVIVLVSGAGEEGGIPD